MRRLQPNAVMFSDAGPDIRWIGNERGTAGTTNWSTVDPSIVTYPGMSGDAVMRSLQEGDRAGTVWRPGETDVSIRPGWFYHPAEDARVKSVDEVVELYFTSVGRNSKLLLNIPPTPDGLLHDIDVSRIAAMRARLDRLFRSNLAARRSLRWRRNGTRGAFGELVLGRAETIGMADLREDIARGQVVARYVLEGFAGGAWRPLASGTTIGYRKLERFEPLITQRVRLTISDAVDEPGPLHIGLFAPA